MRGDAELASVMRKLIRDGQTHGYVNSGHWQNVPWVTVDCRQVEITEEEAHALEEAMNQ